MRSIDFSGFLGNEEIKVSLNAAFSKNRLPHALILQGEDGLGKHTLARLLARAAVCSGELSPCGVCGACVRALAGSHPDIRVEEGTGVTGSISVDSIKGIIEDAYRKPMEASIKVYLLFVKSKISEASQNKLLKIIEEPPGDALFILTVNSAESLLPTIRSRSQVLTLHPLKEEQAAEYLVQKEGIEPEDARQLARIHGGNLGRMLGGALQAGELAVNISNIFYLSDGDALLAATAPLIKDRDLFTAVLCHLEGIFRDALVINCGGEPTGINPGGAEKIGLAHRRQRLIKLPEICREFMVLTGRNINMNLLVTSFCAKLRNTLPGQN